MQRHGQLGGEDNVAVPGSCPAVTARMVGGHTSGWWERLHVRRRRFAGQASRDHALYKVPRMVGATQRVVGKDSRI